MDFKFLVHTVRSIILDPVREWDVIRTENKSGSFFSRSLLFPLLITASVSAFLGSFLFTNTELTNAYSVLIGVRYFIMLYLIIIITTFIFKEITIVFGYDMAFKSSFKIIVCSLVPFFLCQIISRLFESFIFINILSFYGLYILWTGIANMINPEERKKIFLMISAAAAFIVLLFFANWILTLVFDKLYFSIFA
jgi:Yip1 domain